MNSWISLSIAALFVWFGFTADARAQHTVAVLGVRSVDGEDDLERRIAHGIRAATAELPGYKVSERAVSLDQMLLAHGCDEPNDTCLAQVSQTLAVDLLVYGTVAAKDGAHDLTLQAFDARSGHSTSTSASKLSAAQLSPSGLPETLPTQLRPLFGLPINGTLRIEVNRPGALIAIDGEPRGSVDERGLLELSLPQGTHVVRASDPAGLPIPEPGAEPIAPQVPFDERSVELAIGETTQLALTLPDPAAKALPEPVEPAPRRKRSLRRIFGWVSVGLGAAFAAATVYSWVRIERINSDDDYLAYRREFPRGEPGSSDVCKSAAEGALAARDPSKADLEKSANDLCKEADTLEALQWVFLSGALVGGGVGTYLLLTAPRRREAPRATLQPRFDGTRAMLEARFTF